MGLAISRSIVQAHGGQIWASRNPDRGLTLHVEIPVPSDAASRDLRGGRRARHARPPRHDVQ
jgi:two-component system sensor kinase FixL